MESKTTGVSVNGRKTRKILIILKCQKGPDSKNDRKINPSAKN